MKDYYVSEKFCNAWEALEVKNKIASKRIN